MTYVPYYINGWKDEPALATTGETSISALALEHYDAAHAASDSRITALEDAQGSAALAYSLIFGG